MIRSFIFGLALGLASNAATAVDSTADRPALTPEQFAWQWPLNFPAAAQMAELTLTPAVYRQLQRDDLSDLAAFNAAGESMPLGPVDDRRSSQMVPTPRALALPIFPLSAASGETAEGFRLSVERDARGQLRRLDAEVAPGAAMAPTGTSGWIVDASQLDQPVVGFLVELAIGDDEDLNASVLIEGSDDLQRWRLAAPPRALVSLNRDGLRLQRLGLDVPAARFQFWRLRAEHELALPIANLKALIAPGGVQPKPLSRIELETATATQRAGEFTYQLAGPLPVERIDVRLADRNALANVIIESRARVDQGWTERARGVAFLLPGDIGMQPLATALSRDRHWRLRSEPPLPRAPELTASYRDEKFVVLAQGEPPYRLAAGSVTALRPDYPLKVPLAALAARDRGQSSLVALDLAGEGSPLSGDAALIAPKAPTPWRQWALWGVLLVGVIAIGGMAVGLMRSSRSHQDGNR